jgi:hypothetical protein
MSYEEMRLLEDRNNRKKWINKSGFFTSIGKSAVGPNIIPNYVNATPSESPLVHKFRNIEKDKWVSNKGFI